MGAQSIEQPHTQSPMNSISLQMITPSYRQGIAIQIDCKSMLGIDMTPSKAVPFILTEQSFISYSITSHKNDFFFCISDANEAKAAAISLVGELL